METNSGNNMRICGYCRQIKPLEAFYVNKNTFVLDRYCKDCRKRLSHARYLKSQSVNRITTRSVITQTEDAETRMSLIRQARQVVKESIARKQKKIREEEARYQ